MMMMVVTMIIMMIMYDGDSVNDQENNFNDVGDDDEYVW